MAKVRNNLVVHGLSGMIGKQLVVRRSKNGSYVISAAPARSEGREPTPAQKEHQERFRQAIAYAKASQDRPEYEEAAAARAQSGFNVAVADFFHPPEIKDIDLSEYHGGAGQVIAVVADDDIKVAKVGVLIATDDGVLVEKGAAVPSETDSRRWTYKTTAASPAASVKVVVDVADLAGQVTEEAAHT